MAALHAERGFQMLHLWDELICQVFHSRWMATVSYSRQGYSCCLKRECRAQQRSDEEYVSRALATDEFAGEPNITPIWRLNGRVRRPLCTHL